jgi:hypothetical protein
MENFRGGEIMGVNYDKENEENIRFCDNCDKEQYFVSLTEYSPFGIHLCDKCLDGFLAGDELTGVSDFYYPYILESHGLKKRPV